MALADIDTAFPPVVDANPRILILGSMPGQRSLAEQQYYAHPRNAFWPIIRRFFALPKNNSYAEVCQNLTTEKIALWDVLAECARPGSLDQHIDPTSVVVNDFETFLQRYPSIERILFNGGKSAELFQRHAKPKLSKPEQLELIRLPSTSPANAAMRWEEKYQHWAEALIMDQQDQAAGEISASD